MNVSGQNEEEVLLFEEENTVNGPFWISASCVKISCPGLSLEIDDNGEEYYSEDNHKLEWGGILGEGALVSLFSSSEINIDDVKIEIIIANNYSEIEGSDLIDSIPFYLI